MKLSSYQRFEVRRIPRSLMKPHPENPREILPKSRKALKALLKGVGCVEPPVWNEITGHQLSYHQRIAILDELERGKDYELDVCVVRVPQERETEILIALNNPEAQGRWNMDLLGDLLARPGIVLEHTGFSLADIPVLFETHPLLDLQAVPPDVADAVNAQGPDQEEKPKGGKGTPGSRGRTAEDYRDDIDGYKDRTDGDATDCGYVVVVCESLDQRAQLMRALDADDSQRYVEARAILARLTGAG